MKYQRYPVYKDSGVECLGEVPAHWEVKRLKHLTSKIGSGKTPRGGSEVYVDCGILFIRSQNVYDDGLRLDDATYITSETDNEMSDTRVLPGDILLNITGASLGRTCIVPVDIPTANVNQHVCIIRVEHPEMRHFVSLGMKSFSSKSQIDVFQNGAAREGLNYSQIGMLSIAIPLPDEQEAIAIFLDRETAKIDALIAKQERLIALLQEKRQALISHVVTKGLNPDVPMKDSGVEWIGQIPAHWDRAPLKHLVNPEITDGPHETPEFFDSGYPFLSAEAVKNNALDFDRKRGYIDSATFERYSKKCQPQRGDILMVKSGNTTGALAIVETDDVFAIWSPLALIRTKPEINPRFAFYCMSSLSFQQGVSLFSSYGTQPNIGMGVIENLLMTVPPLDEQVAIVSYLDHELANINILISKVTEAIQKLRERRTALISAAVTGKIDVRNLVN